MFKTYWQYSSSEMDEPWASNDYAWLIHYYDTEWARLSYCDRSNYGPGYRNVQATCLACIAERDHRDALRPLWLEHRRQMQAEREASEKEHLDWCRTEAVRKKKALRKQHRARRKRRGW
jgi:hypothetical protein